MTKKEYQEMQRQKREAKEKRKEPQTMREYLEMEDYTILEENEEVFKVFDTLLNIVEEFKKSDLYPRYEAYKKYKDYLIVDDEEKE